MLVERCDLATLKTIIIIIIIIILVSIMHGSGVCPCVCLSPIFFNAAHLGLVHLGLVFKVIYKGPACGMTSVCSCPSVEGQYTCLPRIQVLIEFE